jgi:hypothetical protein
VREPHGQVARDGTLPRTPLFAPQEQDHG